MQSTPKATNIESRILSILRAGEMIRFVLIPDGNRKIDFGIEGSSADPAGNDLLADRLSLILNEMRSHGYAFGKRTRQLPSRQGLSRQRKERHSSKWMEIRPQSLSTTPRRLSRLGFGVKPESNEGQQSLRLPDLPPSFGGYTLDPPAKLVADLPQVELFEIEFVRTDLPETATSVVEEALRFQLSNQQTVVQVNQPTLSQVFLSSWLWHRTGWKITVRARLKNGHDVPVAPLEMLGRDLFLCECEVASAEDEENPEGRVDLRNVYPKGWPFPPILPAASVFDAVAATRMHNVSLPDLPKKGLKIGVAEGADVRLPVQSRDRHTYIVGATGTGKTTLLTRMIREDMEAGEGVILLDPHGDLHAEIVEAVPKARRGDLVIVDPTREDCRPGLNILDVQEGHLRKRHTELLIGELIQCFRDIWDVPEAFGPMFEVYFRNAIQLMTLRNGEPLTVECFNRVFTDKAFRSELIAECADPSTAAFWKDVAEKAGGECSLANITPYIACKMSPLTQGAFLTCLLTQPKDEIRLADRINRAPIVLVNLNKGVLGVQESRILGVILMAQIMSAGLKRSLMSRKERHPVNIYVDEFQNFVSDNVASMLSEARKFGLRLTLANQTLAQLKAKAGRQNLLETVLGNVGNMILFRLGVPDAEKLKLFIEPFSCQEMQELPNFHALVRLLTPEGPVRPLIMQTLPG
jgi:hypothetical protein